MRRNFPIHALSDAQQSAKKAIERGGRLLWYGATRTGKTYAATLGLAYHSRFMGGARSYLLCGQSAERVRDNTADALSHFARRADLPLSVSKNGARLGRAEFAFVGFADERARRRVQGASKDGVLIDEATLADAEFLNMAASRANKDGAALVMTSNADSPFGAFKREWIDQPDARRCLVMESAWAERVIGEEAARDVEASFAGLDYDRYIGNEWIAARGLVYPVWHNCAERHVVSGRTAIGVDYGATAPTAAVALKARGDGGYCAVGEYYEAGDSVADHAAAVARLGRVHGARDAWIDPSATALAYELRRRGAKVSLANNDVRLGIQQTRLALETGAVKIHADAVPALTAEIGSYRYSERAADDKPLKRDDHAMDALRYAVMAVAAGRKVIAPASAFGI